MKLLAFDTSTETLSVAVACAGQPLLEHRGPGGAHASETLVPTIQSLLAHAGVTLGELDAIVFGRGPGSFTGLRTACSVAQGLGFGANVALLPVDTLLAVAEQARGVAGATRVVAVLDARMDEVYFGRYVHAAGHWRVDEPPRLGRPEDVRPPEGWTIAGNAGPAYGARFGRVGEHIAALPTAAALLRLAPGMLAEGKGLRAADALPLYIRDKVAQTMQERASLRR
ncbi:MAG TPA: tRNA (adenosine(37)-N6)-threonylcarbamoyltransferase complex dimerization subunit type 1 TsaB [Ramlibacter sp.]|uniref:tRNA (adenosine(37)-N6)-threonylcarbamoyltransferase complex dimerization subunit type 1 TsaB n=1 Tax=Ramlibacter sp. TaxID=1917967 RepID=UPI002BF01FE4|nr:tRNA (adenosine(37)-N6)-threonylcarbamoyltransferase complex dimerization subunit type 1 TsaB [Ramlibacter sp.]HVZ47128.1 tRNA (adenosine(37)-N6)-threonylcarbamoyltransferase complex dimerization subunit type 1 TsaB [Ramlibacter sp.]